MNFFNGLRDLMTSKTAHDSDLKNWANIEYKKDAVYAFNYIKEHGQTPVIGVKV